MVWKRLLVNATHAHDRAAFVNLESVFADEFEYPTWMARVEASAIVCLAHPDREVRTTALPVLQVAQECRDARGKLREAMREAGIGGGASDSAEATPTQQLQAGCPTVAGILAIRGPSIVQKGLYRYAIGVWWRTKQSIHSTQLTHMCTSSNPPWFAGLCLPASAASSLTWL